MSSKHRSVGARDHACTFHVMYVVNRLSISCSWEREVILSAATPPAPPDATPPAPGSSDLLVQDIADDAAEEEGVEGGAEKEEVEGGTQLEASTAHTHNM